MALAQFVRNVDDLSDDGGYKFRFHCDVCRDGVESEYKPAATNLLKTGLEVFSMFRMFGSHTTRQAVKGIDRGLRGKERDAAYQEAVEVAKAHFHKCSACGKWACDHCHNAEFQLCEQCAPNAGEEAAKAAARRQARERVAAVEEQGADAAAVTCTSCGKPAGGGKFCQHCGTPTVATRHCTDCGEKLNVGARFCGGCGKPAN